MQEFISSIKDNIANRLNSSLYGSFLISWCLWNWKAIYITIFVDQKLIYSKSNILKIEYLSDLYSLKPWLPLFSTIANTLILPAISAYIITFWLCKIEYIFFKKTVENQNIKKKIVLEQESIFLEKEKINLQTKNQIFSNMSTEEKWGKEFDDNISNSSFYNSIGSLQNCLYKFNGYIETRDSTMSAEHLSVIISFNLAKYSEGSYNKLEITEKGKYFLRKYVLMKHN